MFFAKNTGKNIGKNISKILGSKYSQKLLDCTKKSAADALKTAWKRGIQKTAAVTGDLIAGKIANNITEKVPQSTLEIVESETGIAKETYISPEERHQIIDELRLILLFNNNINMEYRKILNLLDKTQYTKSNILI